MKKFLRNSCQWLVMLVAMFAVSVSASAQYDLLGSGTKVFNATGTLDGTYTTTFEMAKGAGMPFSQNSTAAVDVVNSAKVKVASASVSLSGYDVTFTVSGSTAAEDGAYTIVVPEGYFYAGYSWMPYNDAGQKFTINLTGATAGGGGGQGGEGGGGGDGGGTQGGGGGGDTPSGQPLNVTFDFSKAFVAEQDGITCESDGQYNSVYGWQLKADKHITFTAPYGYLISQIVLNDVTGNRAYYYLEIDDGATWDCGNTWTGEAGSVTLTAYYSCRLTTATITLVKDPSAKDVFDPFTTVTPATGSTVESLETLTLTLPDGLAVDRDVALGTTISVNGSDAAVSAITTDGTDVVITLTDAITTDGEYAIVIPQGFVTAGDGSISPETEMAYTVNSPLFYLTDTNFGPKPGDDIEINLDPENLEVFKTINIYYPDGIVLNEGTVSFTLTAVGGGSKKITANLYAYDGQAVLNFQSNSITKAGNYTFKFPEGAFTSTNGKKSAAFELTYAVGVKHNRYSVNLNLGAEMPEGTTITVEGESYKQGDVVSTTAVLSAADIVAAVAGYRVVKIEVQQPTVIDKTSYDGSILVTYEEIAPVTMATADPATGKYYATYYAPFAWSVPTGLTAYVVGTIDASGAIPTAQLSAVEGVVPANTGVILEASVAGEYAILESADTPATIGSNLLRGVTTGQKVYAAAGEQLYKLALNEAGTKVGFYWDAEGGASLQAAAGKAYLAVSVASSNGIAFKFDGVTAIDAIATEQAESAIYNLQGQRVVAPLQGGLYIKNGKKFVLQNN